jgi:hypothetical protein
MGSSLIHLDLSFVQGDKNGMDPELKKKQFMYVDVLPAYMFVHPMWVWCT